jgi:hypothetical protein
MFKFAAVLLLLSWPANAEDRLYYTFSEWARLQDDDRVAYISGLFEMNTTRAKLGPVGIVTIKRD